MKNVIVVLVLVVAGIIGLGISRGWLRFSTGSNDSKANVNVQVDKDKMHKDADKATDKVEDLAKDAKNAVAATTQKD